MAFGSLRYLLMRIAIAFFSSIENSLNAFSVMACAKLAFFCSLDSAFELICSFVD
jgi:lipoprotein